jgi:hypothetical protein
MDIDKVLLKLKRLEILSKRYLTTKEQRFESKHDKKNIINLDSSDDELLENREAELKLKKRNTTDGAVSSS